MKSKQEIDAFIAQRKRVGAEVYEEDFMGNEEDIKQRAIFYIGLTRYGRVRDMLWTPEKSESPNAYNSN